MVSLRKRKRARKVIKGKINDDDVRRRKRNMIDELPESLL